MAVLPTLIFAAQAVNVTAGALPPSTWVGLSSIAGVGHEPVFALAVDPVNDQSVIAGGGQGGIYRTTDGGATWTQVLRESSAVLTIAFSPFNPGLVLAGTRGGGAFLSTDGGGKWSAAAGLEARAVRAFGFARTVAIAGTDHGVYGSGDAATWTPLGLSTSSIDAVAVAAVNPPIRFVVGGEAAGAGGIPMWQSLDAGATWSSITPAISGTIITKIAAGPLLPNANVRPIVVGTNTGLFISQDNAATFTALSSGALLPSTDYTQIDFTAAHYDRFYVASDGGGGESGGVWATGDSGQDFSSLSPPLPAVTALAVSGDEQPILYVATFRPFDHGVFLWAYHDTGGTPQQPAGAQTPNASGARLHGSSGFSFGDFLRGLGSSQAPYIALGVIALAVLLLAVVSQLRSRRR
jgi:hypothetical protein